MICFHSYSPQWLLQAPARSLRVRLVCGEEDKLYGGTEPATCVYDAFMTTPIACTDIELKGYQSQLR